MEAAYAREQSGQAHGAIAQFLRQTITDYRAGLLQRYPRGDRFAARFAGLIDALLKSLIALATNSDAPPFALAAVGGYGRSELAPFSDVDLLFLHREADLDHMRAAIDPILYPLWDSGVKLGYGVHTPKSAVAFAKKDIVASTTFLDARFLAGDQALFDAFSDRFDAMRRRSGPAFIKAKLAEQEERQKRSLETRYLVEPDVKDGKGGLRDLQTIEWIYKYVYGAKIGDSKAIAKVLDADEVKSLKRVRRFLWSVRVHMHDLRGYADDALTFDLQPQVAQRLDYAERTDMSPAERLMRHYFMNSIEVGRLTRILCAKLEEEQARRRPRLTKALPKYLGQDEIGPRTNLRLNNGRLDFQSAARARKNPSDFFRYFRAFAKSASVDFHPNALAVISSSLPLITRDVRNDPMIALVFSAMLTKSKRAVRALRVMIETGLLGKYIPAIGELVGRIDYGLYRRFTIDEHVLRCLALLEEMRAGDLEEQHPISTAIVAGADNIFSFYLAVLLHEAIWTVKGQTPDECAKLIIRVSKRLGLSGDEATLVGWVGANSSAMARTAERRNVNDSYTISKFAKEVGSRERLDMLLVLTVCHLRVVGIQSWDDVTREHLTELYRGARDWFEGGDIALARRLNNRAMQTRGDIREALENWTTAERDRFLRRLSGPMLTSVSPDILVRFARLIKAAEDADQSGAVTVTPRQGDLEALVYGEDRHGLIAQLAGQVAAAGLSVRSMNAYTSIDGKALDILVIQVPEGRASDDPSLAKRLHSSLLHVAQGGQSETVTLTRRFGDRRPIFEVTPLIQIDVDASDECVIIDTECLDRPGLLYEMSSALSELGVTIVSAHISTYGERAVDAFYLQDAKGRKISARGELRRIEKRMMRVLDPAQET